ncbi:hypothetical protein U1Q18_048834, partial [Sarracenia purpurea var. burkii]
VQVLDSVENDIFRWYLHRVLVRSLPMGLVCEPVTVGTIIVNAVVSVEFWES